MEKKQFKKPEFKPIKKQAEQPIQQASFEDQTKEEIEEVVSLFKQRAKDEENEKAKNVNTDYWFAVYFADQEQRDEFLKKVNLLGKMEDQYINGETFASALQVPIAKKKIKTPKPFRKNKGFDSLTI